MKGSERVDTSVRSDETVARWDRRHDGRLLRCRDGLRALEDTGANRHRIARASIASNQSKRRERRNTDSGKELTRNL